MNELLTLVQILVAFSLTVATYRIFGKTGLYVMAGVFVLYANLEVANLVDVFGMTVSLGNIAFVGANLIQDTLNETEGEKAAQKTVWFGFLGCISIVLISQISIHFIPNEYDTIHDSFRAVFAPFSIVTAISLFTYLISNTVNVKLYALISKYTNKTWLRSQGSTWISQAVDTLIMTLLCAVFGVFAWETVVDLLITTYLIKIVVMVSEVPFLYINKNLFKKNKIPVY